VVFPLSALRHHQVGRPDVVREVIAKRVIEAAKRGDDNPAALCAAALPALSTTNLIR
jgi:hypothetical protein